MIVGIAGFLGCSSCVFSATGSDVCTIWLAHPSSDTSITSEIIRTAKVIAPPPRLRIRWLIMVAPPEGSRASLFSGAVEWLLTDSLVRGQSHRPEYSHPFLYPPCAMATNVAARKTKIPTVEVNQSIHFSACTLFFTCSNVSSASPQRAIAK